MVLFFILPPSSTFSPWGFCSPPFFIRYLIFHVLPWQWGAGEGGTCRFYIRCSAFLSHFIPFDIISFILTPLGSS